MQKTVASIVALLCALTFVSCTKEKYQKNNAAGSAWLASQTESARTSVTGTWGSFQLGEGSFKQTGRKVTGQIANYVVEGVVSGRKVYLLLSSDGWVYYTAILEKTSSGDLAGLYSEHVPFDENESHPVRLKRW